jgi:hypothetical protein
MEPLKEPLQLKDVKQSRFQEGASQSAPASPASGFSSPIPSIFDLPLLYVCVREDGATPPPLDIAGIPIDWVNNNLEVRPHLLIPHSIALHEGFEATIDFSYLYKLCALNA